MELNRFLELLNDEPSKVEFELTMQVIEDNYHFTPVAFTNGDTRNEVGQNSGSCKIFSFAQLNDLSVEASLACFGKFYRQDVLANPNSSDHANIRNFIQFGWQGVQFEGKALEPK